MQTDNIIPQNLNELKEKFYNLMDGIKTNTLQITNIISPLLDIVSPDLSKKLQELKEMVMSVLKKIEQASGNILRISKKDDRKLLGGKVNKMEVNRYLFILFKSVMITMLTDFATAIMNGQTPFLFKIFMKDKTRVGGGKYISYTPIPKKHYYELKYISIGNNT